MNPLPPILENASIPRAVLRVLEGLGQAGFEVFLVGGCVRDLLLGVPPKDYDVATRARPEEVQRVFKKVIPTGIEHGTVTVLSDGHPVEVTTYRYEAEYLDGRRPSRIDFHHDLREDLARRDFTINAMAFNPLTRRLEDPFDGQGDLKRRVVRCVGDPAERFGEDGLRPLRAIRISTVLEFTLDPATQAAIAPAVLVFRKVALERVHDELIKLVLARRPAHGLALLRSTSLLETFLPELPTQGIAERFARVEVAPADEAIRMALLLWGLSEPFALLMRLKFPKKIAERVQRLTREPLLALDGSSTDAQLRRWAAKLGAEEVDAAVAIARALGHPAVEALSPRLQALLAQKPPLCVQALALDGKGIMDALGVGPSPVVGEATRYLMDQVLEDPALNDPARLKTALQAWARARAKPF